MMQRLFAILFSALLLSVGFSACSSDGCLDNSSSIPLAAFYQKSSNSAVSVAGLTVRGIGAPGDSCILKDTTASQVYLPLLANANQTLFEFKYSSDSLAKDTLMLEYKVVPVFVSNDCGAMYNFDITSTTFTGNHIDSVAVVRNPITNVDAVSIKIFFD